MADVSGSAPEEGKKHFVQKPEKPDQELFEKNLKQAQDEHAAVRDKLNEIKAKLDYIKTPGKSPRHQELRDQLSYLSSAQQAKKNARAAIEEEMRALDASIKARIKEQNASKGKFPYKSMDELDAAIQRLERSIAGGELKLVDERRAVDEISSLNRSRKNFGAFAESQKAIDADKARFEELKQQKKDPEVQELSEKYEAVKKELDDLKAEQDNAFQDINNLRDQRTALNEEQQGKWQEIQNLKDEYFSAKNAYRAYEQEAWKIKREKRAKADKEARIAYKRQIAQQKMEEASEKAYASEILTCEGLIGFFDPSSAEAARKAKLESGPRALAAQPTRIVEAAAPTGTKLAKKEDRGEDYFAGPGKKKGKKGRKEATNPAPESAEAAAGGKFSLSIGVLEELAKIDVETPGSKDDVPKTLEKLREKLAWFKEHQEIKTKENIAKAQKEIDRLEAEDSDGASGAHTLVPKAETVEVTAEENGEKAE